MVEFTFVEDLFEHVNRISYPDSVKTKIVE